MGIPINKDTGGANFTLTCYENDDLSGDDWVVTPHDTPNIPNDEIRSFKLRGDKGIRVEFFNSDNIGNTAKTWAEVTLSAPGQVVEIGRMNQSAGNYVHHKVGNNDDIAGKVSSIRISRQP